MGKFVHYNWEFVITEFVITEFDYNYLFYLLFNIFYQYARVLCMFCKAETNFNYES